MILLLREKLVSTNGTPVLFSVYHWQNIEEKEKKRAQKQEKKIEEAVKQTALQIIESVMAAAEKEPLPTTAEAKEKYFMEQVGAGESLCNRGKLHFDMVKA